MPLSADNIGRLIILNFPNFNNPCFCPAEGTPSALPVKLGVSESTEIPVSFITPLADVYVYEKDEARFELEVSREPKSFRWLKGPQELLTDDKFELLVEGKKHILLIKSAKYEDEAKYTFEAEDKRTSGKLFIQGKLAWTYLVEQGHGKEESAKFVFLVLGKSGRQNSFTLCEHI